MSPQVERVIAEQGAGAVQYLVKWRGLGYTEATWEAVESLASEADKVHLPPPVFLRRPRPAAVPLRRLS